MARPLNPMNKEQTLELNSNSMAAFVSKLQSLGADKLSYGAAIMPRAVWSQGMVSAMISVGIIQSEEQADKALVVFNSDLGNSSQLGAMLLKKGVIKQEQATQAASSFAAEIARLAAAKA